jgi:hypothetical protein
MGTVRLRKHFVLFVSLAGLFFLAGCAIYPYTEKQTLSVRYDADKHVVEKLVQVEKGTGYWELVGPTGGGSSRIPHECKCYVLPAHGSRTEVTCLTFTKNGNLSQWYVWPVLGTTQWVAITYDYKGSLDTNLTTTDVLLNLYLFSPTQIIHHRVLTMVMLGHYMYPRETPGNPDSGYPDFRFDEANQHLTYMVANGYETYDLLQDTVYPSSAPSGKPALTAIDSWVRVRDPSHD